MNKENILEICYCQGQENNSPPPENCLECGEKLSYEWVSQKNQKEMKGEIGGKPANYWTQIWGGTCVKCGKAEKPEFYPRVIFKDKKIKNISPELEKEYQPERKLIEKIASILLPNQKLKIRFTENYGIGVMEPYGITNFYQDPSTGWEVLNICFPIKLLNNREKTNPGILCEAIAWQLAWASVVKNPHRSQKNLENCGCKNIIPSHSPEIVALKNKGNGYDKIWHNKLNEFRERIKNEKLTAECGYAALGKEFILRNNLPYSVISPEGENPAIIELNLSLGGWQEEREEEGRGREPKRIDFFGQKKDEPSPTDNKNKNQNEEVKKNDFPWGWVIGGGIVIVVLVVVIIILLCPKKKRK